VKIMECNEYEIEEWMWRSSKLFEIRFEKQNIFKINENNIPQAWRILLLSKKWINLFYISKTQPNWRHFNIEIINDGYQITSIVK